MGELPQVQPKKRQRRVRRPVVEKSETKPKKVQVPVSITRQLRSRKPL